MGEAITISISLRPDVDAAPIGKYLLTWGSTGWRFMRKDEVSQWRSVLGLPKSKPELWAELPKGFRKAMTATQEAKGEFSERNQANRDAIEGRGPPTC